MKLKDFDDVIHNLPKIESSGIEYSPGLDCPSCKHDFINDDINKLKKLVGFDETDRGFLGVFECTKCFLKFKHHLAIAIYNKAAFKSAAGIKLWLQKDMLKEKKEE